MNSVKSFAISGFCNYIGPVKHSDKGVPYRNILIATGKDKPTYSVTLLNEHCRLAEFEISKGCKIRLLKVRLQPDTKAKNFVENKIVNAFSVIAEDWEVVEDFTGTPANEVFVSNGTSFHGFVNHVKEGRTTNNTDSLSVLVCEGKGKPTVSYTTYGKNIQKVQVNKGTYIFVNKISLNPVRDDNFTENNIASKFYVSLIDCEERKARQHDDEGTSQTRSERQAPPVDYANDDDYETHRQANREHCDQIAEQIRSENGLMPGVREYDRTHDEQMAREMESREATALEMEEDEIPF